MQSVHIVGGVRLVRLGTIVYTTGLVSRFLIRFCFCVLIEVPLPPYMHLCVCHLSEMHMIYDV